MLSDTNYTNTRKKLLQCYSVIKSNALYRNKVNTKLVPLRTVKVRIIRRQSKTRDESTLLFYLRRETIIPNSE